MKTLAAVMAFALFAGAGVAHAQMDESQSQDARAALNSQQAAGAQAQIDQNAANQQTYQAEKAEQGATMMRRDMHYDAAMERHHARVRRYHRAMRAWRADVAACNAGDRARCAHPRPMM